MIAAMQDDESTHAAADRLRAICLALPEVTERMSHGEPAWFVREKREVATFWRDHHSDGEFALICPAPPGAQEMLIDAAPDRFYRPKYVGAKGWVAMRLAEGADWDEVAAIVAEADRLAAPPDLVARLSC